METGKNVVLHEAIGSDPNLTFSTNTSRSFATPRGVGSTYLVTVLTQPDGETCTVNAGSGTVTMDVTVSVTCLPGSDNISAHQLSVAVSGLGAGKTAVLRESVGSDYDLSFTTNSTQEFSTARAHGSTYTVTVATQPAGQTCTVTSGSGTLTADSTVNVSCVNNTYTLSVAMSGLGASKTAVIHESVGSDSDLSFTTNTTQRSRLFESMAALIP